MFFYLSYGVRYRNQPYPGGKSIDGSTQCDFLDIVDGVLLQWYSGFDATLCMNSPDPQACSCNNVRYVTLFVPL